MKTTKTPTCAPTPHGPGAKCSGLLSVAIAAEFALKPAGKAALATGAWPPPPAYAAWVAAWKATELAEAIELGESLVPGGKCAPTPTPCGVWFKHPGASAPEWQPLGGLFTLSPSGEIVAHYEEEGEEAVPQALGHLGDGQWVL